MFQIVVDALMNTVDARIGPLPSKGVVFQDVGSTVPFPHASATSRFTLNPRVQAFMTSSKMQERVAHVDATKAMQELGFQACCLRCDAPDQPGVSRCGPCIQHHRAVRETLAAAPPDDPLYQLAKEIMAMAADPHRYDHDEVHGDSLIEQQRLAAALVGAPAPRTSDDIARFLRCNVRQQRPTCCETWEIKSMERRPDASS